MSLVRLFGRGKNGALLKPLLQSSTLEEGGTLVSVRLLSTLPPPQPGSSGGRKKSSKVKGVITFVGSAVAVGGLIYGYNTLTDNQFDFGKFSTWIQQQVGWSSDKGSSHPVPSFSSPKSSSSQIQEKKGSKLGIGRDTQVNCDPKESSSPTHDLATMENAELEKILNEMKGPTFNSTKQAVHLYTTASNSLKEFMDKVYHAIEQDVLESPEFEKIWSEIYESAVKRNENVKTAESKGHSAWELLCQLREVVQNAKISPFTVSNPLLAVIEEAVSHAQRELLEAKSKFSEVQSSSQILEKYQSSVQEFRKKLKTEVDSILAGVSGNIADLTDNEFAMMLTHSYKKVLHLQNELTQLQMTSLPEPKTAGGVDLSSEETQSYVEKLKKFYETEMTKYLIKQSEVFEETFKKAKEALRKEYERRLTHQSDLREAEHLVELRIKYNQAIAGLTAVKQALIEHKANEKKSERLRKLWVFCNTLYNKIHLENPSAIEDSGPVFTGSQQRLIKEFDADDKFVVELLKTIPESVSSTEQLRSRFFSKVDVQCRKLAVFRPEEDISLGKYIWGVLTASFLTRCEGESDTNTSVNGILDRTAFHLRRGELLEATYTLNKLEGLPRQVCLDWMSDARKLLETRQTIFALMTHAVQGNSN